LTCCPGLHVLARGLPIAVVVDRKRFVYILRSNVAPERHYVGLTSDVEHRLRWHNHGPKGATIRYRPWSVVVSIEFADAEVAGRFERYLKSGSGRAFARLHFAPSESTPILR
jgi:putative endonuclease